MGPRARQQWRQRLTHTNTRTGLAVAVVRLYITSRTDNRKSEVIENDKATKREAPRLLARWLLGGGGRGRLVVPNRRADLLEELAIAK